MKKNAKWSMKTLRTEMALVFRDISDRRAPAEQLARQRPQLQDPYYLADIASSLEDLGSLASIGGALRVLDNDLDGWIDLERAFLWRFYEQRALKRLFDQDWRPARQPRSNPRDLAIVTLQAVTFGRTELSWCRAELYNSLDGGPFGEVRSFSLATYALWLTQTLEVKSSAQYEGSANSVYRGVVDAWSDERRLDEATCAMCEYHENRTIDEDDSELWVEFEVHPYPVFPVEYLALAQTRRRLELAVPTCDHPLLSTTLAQLPALTGQADIRGYEHLETL